MPDIKGLGVWILNEIQTGCMGDHYCKADLAIAETVLDLGAALNVSLAAFSSLQQRHTNPPPFPTPPLQPS